MFKSCIVRGSTHAALRCAIFLLVGVLPIGAIAAAENNEPSAEETLKELREQLLGDWVATSYDANGLTGQELQKKESVTITIEMPLPKRDGMNRLYMRYHKSALKAFPGIHPHNSGEFVSDVFEITPEDSHWLAVPTELFGFYFIFKLDGNTLMISPSHEGYSGKKPTLAAKKGSDDIVFYLRRKKDLAKEKQKPQAKPQPKENEGAHSAPSLEMLYGKWIGESYERNGKPSTAFRRNQRASLTLNAFSREFEVVFAKFDQSKTVETSFDKDHVVDFTTTPMRFYRLINPGSDEEPREKRLIAIFQLEGDRLTWCRIRGEEEMGDDRPPLELTTREGDFRTIVHFRRAAP